MVAVVSSSNPGSLGENLVPLINKLQDIFSQVSVDFKLSLPQIAVIGSQSSGKSSVLEALVGKDFLPRGNDIVTRRPLVLQLVKTSAASSALLADDVPSEWGEFLHVPGKQFHDFERIRQEIQAETDRVVGHNKNVSEKPIRLKIFSPHVLTMTLVDLPGMTRVPVGDQPSDIEHKIRDMALEYIRQPSCIILAVTPANSDLANSDALHMARMVDPDGHRTIGVLTKLDIMDRGTSAAHILRNTLIPLRLGYVGVVLRCQEDIDNKAPMAEAQRSESAFFASASAYRDVASQCGVPNLARRLNTILVEHIRNLLPGLRRRVQELLEQRNKDLQALGDASPLQSKSARGAFLLQLLCDYSERLGAMLDGRHVELPTRDLSGGARVRYVFNELFGRSVREQRSCQGISDEEVSTVIKNGAGVTGNLLVPQEPFELLVRRAISQLLPPAVHCKEAVHEELLRIAEQACPRDAARFPGLQRALAHAVMDFIRSGADPAERMIRHLVECELDYINCDHPEFIGGRGAIRAVMQERSIRAAQTQAAKTAQENPETSSSGKEVLAAGHVNGLPSRANNKSTTSTNGSFDGVLSSNGNSSRVVGLKGLPDASSSRRSGDELLSRTRRRSHDGQSGVVPGGFDIVGGTWLGGGAVSSAAVPLSGASTSNWLSWFNRQEQQQQQQQLSTLPLVRPAAPRGSLSPSTAATMLGAMHRTEQEELEVEVIRKLVDSYFCIVRKTLLDQVPKAIMHFMVNNTKRGMQQHLIQQLYRDDVLDDLLQEREEVAAQRKAGVEAVQALQDAAKALGDVPGELSTYGVLGDDGSQPPLIPGNLNNGPALCLLPSSVGTSGSIGSSAFSNFYSTSITEDLALKAGALGIYDRSPSMTIAANAASMASYSLQSENMRPVI